MDVIFKIPHYALACLNILISKKKQKKKQKIKNLPSFFSQAFSTLLFASVVILSPRWL